MPRSSRRGWASRPARCVLTIAVTIIEVHHRLVDVARRNNPTLAREAVFSVVMIVCSGVVGICLMSAPCATASRSCSQQGTTAFLSVLVGLSVLALILPNYTGDHAPWHFSTGQLIFVCAGVGAALRRLPVHADGAAPRGFLDMSVDDQARRQERPSTRTAVAGFVFLLAGLLAVVLLAKLVAAWSRTASQRWAPEPDPIVGALIACLVLLPEPSARSAPLCKITCSAASISRSARRSPPSG